MRLNSKIHTNKKMADGFRNGEHFKTAIYAGTAPRSFPLYYAGAGGGGARPAKNTINDPESGTRRT